MNILKKDKIFEWLDFYASKSPERFNEYFYEDVVNYLKDSDMTIKELLECKNREEVKVWLDKVTGFIVMKFDVEPILESYFTDSAER